MIARESSIVSINSDRTKFPKIYKWLIKKFYNSFYGIICQSEYMQQDLTLNFKIPPGKTTVIHNPVDEHRGHYLALPGNNPSTKIYKFITVARLSEEKGIDRLIPAVAGLSLPFQYYIIGDGDRRNSLWELIHQFNLQDRVIMVGQKNNPYEGMEDADLMLMGSHYEGFPNVLLEAGALGIPVIAFDVPGGIREIITNGENGILVNDDDIKAFTAAIEKAMLIKFDSYKIIATTKKRFSTAATVIKTEELFLRLHHQPQ